MGGGEEWFSCSLRDDLLGLSSAPEARDEVFRRCGMWRARIVIFWRGLEVGANRSDMLMGRDINCGGCCRGILGYEV